MGWKANTSGLATFLIGVTIVIAINTPTQRHFPASNPTVSAEKQEILTTAREETTEQIKERMLSEFGETITDQQANQLNCGRPNRFSTPCYYKNVVRNQQPTISTFDTMSGIVKRTFGTLTLDESRYTLKAYDGSNSFYIEQH